MPHNMASCHCCEGIVTILSSLVQGYQWLKERVNSEEGRRQLAKIKELHLLADRMGCTAAQLAIGRTTVPAHFLLLCALSESAHTRSPE